MKNLIARFKAWRQRRRNRPKVIQRCNATPEQRAGIKRAMMLGAVGGVSGPLVTRPKEEDDAPSSQTGSNAKSPR